MCITPTKQSASRGTNQDDITSQKYEDKHVLKLNKTTDFIKGAIFVDSYIRPERIFTANKKIILKSVGIVSKDIMDKTIKIIVNILNQ